MERDEYKSQLQNINALIASGEKDDAVELLDGMNWRKIHNVNALVSASEAYEACDRLEDAKDLLIEAHERSPIGRMIIYRLAMICIKRGEFTEAESYLKAFVEIAPHDPMKYQIRYELSKAKHVDDSVLISILEELKESDFMEEWAFELACLYHKTAQADKCIALCDEIILWFGDGPYVEKALELKMLYSPLDKNQEDMYRHFRQQRDGITEINPDERFASGEVVNHTITIPEVQLAPETFNTVNLQAEIKKNIEEIMQATEASEVSENMENIKVLVGDIPYLKGQTESMAEVAEAAKAAGAQIDESLKERYEAYLAEEFGGQMSLQIPEQEEQEEQIKGQMTIEDVMAEWAKTQRAAEAALQDAQEKHLDFVKAQALEQAEAIMVRLEDAKPKLEAGVAPVELLKEEYMSAPKQEEKPVETVEEPVSPMEEPLPPTEDLAEILAGTDLEGGEDITPVIVPEEVTEITPQTEEEETEELSFAPIETAEEAAPVAKRLEDLPDAGQEGKQTMLDGVIAGLLLDESDEPEEPDVAEEPDETEESEENAPSTFRIPKVAPMGYNIGIGMEIPVVHNGQMPNLAPIPKPEVDMTPHEWNPPTLDAEPKGETMNYTEASNIVAAANEMLQQQIDRMKGEVNEAPVEEPEAEEEEIDINLLPTQRIPDLSDPIDYDEESILANAVADMMQKEDVLPDLMEAASDQDVQELIRETSEEEGLPEISMDGLTDEETAEEELPEIAEVELAPEEVAELVDEDVLTRAVEEEIQPVVLDDEERELFSYFLPITGMEESICQALTGAKERLVSETGISRGHIMIEGNRGSGTTTLATGLLQVLQKETGKPDGAVGKIDAEKLNEKNLQAIFKKIPGGALIIENAGALTKEKATELAILSEADTSGILLILEDSKRGLDRLRANGPQLLKHCTEKIRIPVYTIDELVEFAKNYAHDQECVIDEMGILALYNRVNNMQRLDHATSLDEVREVVEEAIASADKGGLKGLMGRFKKHYDEDGYLILQEKDFEE